MKNLVYEADIFENVTVRILRLKHYSYQKNACIQVLLFLWLILTILRTYFETVKENMHVGLCSSVFVAKFNFTAGQKGRASFRMFVKTVA